MNNIENVKIIDNCTAEIKYNREIYSASIINSAAQFMIGKCDTFITQQGELLIVKIITDRDIESIVREFNEELINYKFYEGMVKEKGEIRKMILEHVLTCVLNNKE